MRQSEESVLSQLQSMGVRVYGKTIVSPFSFRDSPSKCQVINFMIEHCGYKLTDEKGYPGKPEPMEVSI